MTPIEVNDILNESEESLMLGYFRLYEHYEALYGPHTIIMIELGSFFEVYGVENDEETIGLPREVADVLNIQLTRRNKNIKENNRENPLMAGFPSAAFERYINRLVQERKYTIVIIRQRGVPPNITRYVDCILSPGVNLDYRQDHRNNFISTVLIEESQGLYSVGYAALDVSTGKTHVFEGHGTHEDKTAALDELFGLLQSHQFSELVFIPGHRDIDREYILTYLELGESIEVQTRKKRLPVTYQNELFRRAYIVKSFLSPIEFLDLEKQPLTSETLAHLLEFVIDHDAQVIERLERPTLIDTRAYLYLGNNPLEQLNIISTDPREPTVLALFDQTSTSIGARLFRDRLTNPVVDKATIEARYDLSDALDAHVDTIRSHLRNVYDLERISRRIRLGRLHPFEINFLYDSLTSARAIIDISEKDAADILPDFFRETSTLSDFITYIEQTFDLDETTKVTNHTISTTLFQPDYQQSLRDLITERQALQDRLEMIRMRFVDLLEQATGKHEPNYVLLKHNDKDRHHLSMTKGRYTLIEDILKDTFLPLDGEVYALTNFSYKVQTTNVKINADIMQTISKEILDLDMRIVTLVREFYAAELSRLDTRFSDYLMCCTTTLARIDVAVSNILSRRKYRLNRPEIIDVAEDTSYISIEALRHPLVEAREEHGIYIPNDIVLGDQTYYHDTDRSSVIVTTDTREARGMLLYGINSSGKSSLMKSVGIAVILAQSGCFVPADRMRFSLFTELFTRIISKDNIEKGLSSFAVEMMELKNIFNRCSSRSLVLGDEISHGTETLSAIAIVAATIRRLSELRALFVFTTHLHQICNLDLMQTLGSVANVHMSVHFDKVADRLIFDRTLQEGNGSTVYGLEFAQSLHMDEAFLRYATDIRKDLSGEYTDIELLTKKTRSKYNKDLYLSSCAICQSQVEDTHHITPQEAADEHGNIGHIHKNHRQNLLPICRGCHDDIHAQRLLIRGFMMTTEGLELSYERVDTVFGDTQE